MGQFHPGDFAHFLIADNISQYHVNTIEYLGVVLRLCFWEEDQQPAPGASSTRVSTEVRRFQNPLRCPAGCVSIQSTPGPSTPNVRYISFHPI